MGIRAITRGVDVKPTDYTAPAATFSIGVAIGNAGKWRRASHRHPVDRHCPAMVRAHPGFHGRRLAAFLNRRRHR
jgi:hypothetical protein